MEKFGTLEFVLDRYSGTWCWKISGNRAVNMVSKLIPRGWYGDKPDEVIVSDNDENTKKLKMIDDRYTFEILSKSVWKRKINLLDFQREGLDFLIKSSGNALLADEMGLGKTVQTLAYISKEKNSFPALIVAPLVTLTNWQREIEKFLKKKGKNGKVIENEVPSSTMIRNGKQADIGEYDFYIINYELLHKRLPDLLKLGIRSVVCDEVQHLRSKTTQKYAAVKELAALESVKYRVGLSGTPIYNRGSEIWPIVDILKPGLLGSFKEFCEYFCYVNEKGKAIVLENKRDTLRTQLTKHVMLRRKKSDVLKELKDKVRDIKTQMRLNEHVTDFVNNIMEIEESVVVFCHHKAIHNLLHSSLSEYEPASIIGGQTDVARQREIDRFQKGHTKLMIAGLRAGNVGINLTNAKYVIFAELDWSPAIHRQAEDRLHRIGQKNTVFAYYLVGKGTLDEHVAEILTDKEFEIDSILDKQGESFENKEKAKMILAQIHDKLGPKL